MTYSRCVFDILEGRKWEGGESVWKQEESCDVRAWEIGWEVRPQQ